MDRLVVPKVWSGLVSPRAVSGLLSHLSIRWFCAKAPACEETRASVRWLAIAFMMLTSAACTGPTQAPGAVCERCKIVCGECEEQDRFVRLQVPSPGLRQDHKSFSHPARLRPEDWAVILPTIRVQSLGNPFLLRLDSAKGQITEVFSEEDVAYLGRTLSQAMAQAQPDEWVVFGLRHNRSPEVTEMTTGGWYVLGSELHLVLANYRFAVTTPSIQELVWENPLSTQGLTYDFIAGTYQKDVSFREGLLRPTARELSIAYQQLLLGEPADQPSQKAVAQPVPVEPARPRSTKDRLQALKEFRDQGLISEQDYQAKKKKLLDEF